MKNIVKELRTKRNLTQEQLSVIVGVSRQTIISLENGKYNASLILAHKLSQAFHCQIQDIFIFEGDENI